MPLEIPPIEFEDLLVMLAKAGVQFVVVGGLAVSFNGFTRATVDVDILVESSKANLEKLLEALSEFGEGNARELKPKDFIHQEGSIRIQEHFDLDIFVQMKGLKFEDAIGESKKTHLRGESIFYLNPSQLIFLKKDSYREKDRLDIRAMAAILHDQKKKK